jgi:hemerythrin-like domain-containing protein
MPVTALAIVHKVLRKQLFDFSHAVSRASPTDSPRVLTELDRVIEFLKQHATHEDELYAPSMATVDAAAAASMKREHAEQDERLESMRRVVQGLATDSDATSDALYQVQLDWHLFVSEMLQHLDREEREWSAALEGVMEDVSALGRVAAGVPPEERATLLQQCREVTTAEEWEQLDAAYRAATDGK